MNRGRLIGFALIAAGLVVLPLTAATASTPSVPRNLETSNIAATSLKLVWGPTQPAGFKVTADTPSTVTLTWTASKDTRKPVTYQVKRDGKTVAKAQPYPSKTFTVKPSTSSFKVCVVAFNSQHQASAKGCSTVNRLG